MSSSVPGGDLESSVAISQGRSRLLLEIIRRVRSEVPALMVGVRLSIFDFVPYRTSREVGQPMDFSDAVALRLWVWRRCQRTRWPTI